MIPPHLYILTDARGFTTVLEEWSEWLALKESTRIPLLAPVRVNLWTYHGRAVDGEWRLEREFTWP